MSSVRPAVPTVPQRVLCPYCGEVSTDPRRCDTCRGFFDPLSRQATQNAMGPWFIRDGEGPWRPGCSIETLREMIRRGKVTRDTILRGPGTKQFWNFAGRTPSVANLLGLCHNCRALAKPDDYSCKACGAMFTPDPDRQHMGLAPVHFLPGEASPEIVAAAALDTPAPVAVTPITAAAPAVVKVIVAPIPPAPVIRVRRIKRQRSVGPWLVALTVIVVCGMGAVFALVATGTITIPWLISGAVPAANPPAPAAPAATAATTETPPPAAEAPSGNTGPTGEPDPTSNTAQPTPTAPTAPQGAKLDAILLPLLNADPFSETAMLARIEELRREQPTMASELDQWAEAAKTRAAQIKLRKIR